MLIRTFLLLISVTVPPAVADHHQSLEFLRTFAGVWDASEGDVQGTMTFVQGTSGQAMYIRGEMGSNKFDDFITYAPKTKTWTIDGAGNDGSRYTHSVKAFPTGKMKAGQQWTAETTGVTADGQPTTGSLHFVAKDSNSYQITIKESIAGEAMPDRVLVARRRQATPETQLSQQWRKFLEGSWTRDTKGDTDGKPEDSQMEWKCVASGNALVSYSTSGDQGYGTLLYWDEELGKLVEQGHSSEGHWKIEFDLKDKTKSGGSISGRLADGRNCAGKILIERTSDDSYTATIKMELSDGETMNIVDRNVRQ